MKASCKNPMCFILYLPSTTGSIINLWMIFFCIFFQEILVWKVNNTFLTGQFLFLPVTLNLKAIRIFVCNSLDLHHEFRKISFQLLWYHSFITLDLEPEYWISNGLSFSGLSFGLSKRMKCIWNACNTWKEKQWFNK